MLLFPGASHSAYRESLRILYPGFLVFSMQIHQLRVLLRSRFWLRLQRDLTFRVSNKLVDAAAPQWTQQGSPFHSLPGPHLPPLGGPAPSLPPMQYQSPWKNPQPLLSFLAFCIAAWLVSPGLCWSSSDMTLKGLSAIIFRKFCPYLILGPPGHVSLRSPLTRPLSSHDLTHLPNQLCPLCRTQIWVATYLWDVSIPLSVHLKPCSQ